MLRPDLAPQMRRWPYAYNDREAAACQARETELLAYVRHLEAQRAWLVARLQPHMDDAICGHVHDGGPACETMRTWATIEAETGRQS